MSSKVVGARPPRQTPYRQSAIHSYSDAFTIRTSGFRVSGFNPSIFPDPSYFFSVSCNPLGMPIAFAHLWQGCFGIRPLSRFVVILAQSLRTFPMNGRNSGQDIGTPCPSLQENTLSITVERELAGRTLRLETGKVAKQ